METSHHDSAEAKGPAGAAMNSSQSEVKKLQEQLLPEMLSLAQSGENPERFRELLKTYNLLRVHRITELLKEEPQEELARVRRLRKALLDGAEAFLHALKRPDLTRREFNLLTKFYNQTASGLDKSLILEKALLGELYSPLPNRGRVQRRGTRARS